MALTVQEVMALAPVVPVLVVDNVADAIPLARALVAGGLPALEVTMRTPVALEVMREMASVPGAVVGAGTVLNPKMLDDALNGRRAVHRVARSDRTARPGSDRLRHGLPAGHGDGGRHHAGSRHGPDAFQILPRLDERGLLRSRPWPRRFTWRASARPAVSPPKARRNGSPSLSSNVLAEAGWFPRAARSGRDRERWLELRLRWGTDPLRPLAFKGGLSCPRPGAPVRAQLDPAVKSGVVAFSNWPGVMSKKCRNSRLRWLWSK